MRKGAFHREVGNLLALLQKLDSIHLNNGLDSVTWSLEISGLFSTELSFLKLTQKPGSLKAPLVDLILELQRP